MDVHAVIVRSQELGGRPSGILGIVGVVIVLFGAAGCGSSPPGEGPLLSASPTTGRSPVEGPVVESSADGLTIQVRPEATTVVAGGTLGFGITLRNDADAAVAVVSQACRIEPRLTVALDVPVEPVGRNLTGVSAEFKTYVLTQGLGPGGVPMTAPVDRGQRIDKCNDEPTTRSLVAGATAEWSLVWDADLADGAPAVAGLATFRVAVRYGLPASTPGASKPIPFTELVVTGELEILPGDAPVISAGQALDSILADQSFVGWLETQDSTTWGTANMFLVGGAGDGIAPPGPMWDIELFREVGVPRTWAIGFVNALTGELASITYCNHPCDR